MRDFDHGPGYGHDHGWFGGHGFPWLGFLVFLVVVAGLVALGVWLLSRTRQNVSIDDPLRHAAARYADGQIGRVEFERIQADLAAAGIGRPAPGTDPPTPPPPSPTEPGAEMPRPPEEPERPPSAGE